MKPVLVLAFIAAAVALSACESMYVGGSVGTLAKTSHQPMPSAASRHAS